MIKVFIIDDHKMVIQGLKLFLEEDSEMKCVGYATSGPDALNQLPEIMADVILLDINMPDMNGIEVCKIIHSKYPKIKVLALTMLKEMSVIKQMLKAGAMGYLLKNSGKDEVLAAIQTVHQGKQYLDKDLSELLIQNMTGQSHSKTSPFPSLTRREKEVLQLIIDENTTQEIADVLGISFGTVEVHRRNILIKLGARNTAGMVRIAFEHKLLE